MLSFKKGVKLTDLGYLRSIDDILEPTLGPKCSTQFDKEFDHVVSNSGNRVGKSLRHI